MKIYVALWLILIALYAIFHFGFKEIGGNHLYRINDQIAFELQLETDSFNGVSVRGYHRTNALVRSVCGACAVDYGVVDMPQANYRKGDWVYSGFPQHETAKTDIVNLRTGETINVDVPGNRSGLIDLTILPEYRERALTAEPQFKLHSDYVKANFEPLSTRTGTCVFVHIAFGIIASLLIFPKVFFAMMDAYANDNNSTNWTRNLGN